MNATPLSLHSPRVAAGLLGRLGWEGGQAGTAAEALAPLAVHLTGLSPDTLETLVRWAGPQGLDVLTGPDWALVSGGRSRLATLAQPGRVPEALRPLAATLAAALPQDPPPAWRTARRAIPLDRPQLAAILNVTPDSFSDGARLPSPDHAVARAERLLADGATMLDVGGESTRPGRTAEVPLDEELARTVPVVERLAREFPEVPISIDTLKAPVARACLEAGAEVVNDVSGLRLDPAMAAVVRDAGAGLVLMHSRGPSLELSSYAHAGYGDDPVGGVLGELRAALAGAVQAGIAPEAIALDPGFGFAKTTPQSLALLDQLAAFRCLGRALYVGPSRKRFLGDATGLSVEERDEATAVACALLWERGARIFRTHDVRLVRAALALARAVETGSPNA